MIINQCNQFMLKIYLFLSYKLFCNIKNVSYIGVFLKKLMFDFLTFWAETMGLLKIWKSLGTQLGDVDSIVFNPYSLSGVLCRATSTRWLRRRWSLCCQLVWKARWTSYLVTWKSCIGSTVKCSSKTWRTVFQPQSWSLFASLTG